MTRSFLILALSFLSVACAGSTQVVQRQSATERLRARLAVPRALVQVAVHTTPGTEEWSELGLRFVMRYNPVTFSIRAQRDEDGAVRVAPGHNPYANWHQSTCVIPFTDGFTCPMEAPMRRQVPIYALAYLQDDDWQRQRVSGESCERLMQSLEVSIEERPQRLSVAGNGTHCEDDGCSCIFELRDASSPESLAVGPHPSL